MFHSYLDPPYNTGISEALDVRDKWVRDQRMFGTIRNFATSKYNFASHESWHMFVTVQLSFNAYACHEVHFVPKSSRHEVTFHPRRNEISEKFLDEFSKIC